MGVSATFDGGDCYNLFVVSEDLPGYFDVYGWRYERREPRVFRTGFVGENGAWDIWVTASELLVVFLISPYVDRPEDVAPGAPLLRTILKANHELNLAKLGLDDEHDVCLSVEMPAEGFGYSQFSDALTAIAHYADELKDRLDTAVAEDAEDHAIQHGVL